MVNEPGKRIWGTMESVFLAVYGVLFVIFGVFLVPMQTTWGPQRELYGMEYGPFWWLIKARTEINGYMPVYEIMYGRLFYGLFVMTVIAAVAYILFKRTAPVLRSRYDIHANPQNDSPSSDPSA